MASRKFRFVSPGVFLKEIDKSQLPGIPAGIGPVIIGRTIKGPSLTPYKVRSLDEFTRVFGGTSPGLAGDDPWRDGTDLLAESYAPYAAKAYLSADIDSPVTIVRLAGIAGDDASASTDSASPGWKTDNSYGLLLFPNSSTVDPSQATNVTGTLAAIFYGDSGFTASLYAEKALMLDHAVSESRSATGAYTSKLVKEDGNGNFRIRLEGSGSRTKDVVFSPESIRPGFNTNPIKTNDKISEDADAGLADLYWLGESFEEKVREMKNNLAAGDTLAAMMVELDPQISDLQSSNHALTAARTGWFIAQDTSGASDGVVHASAEKLFRAIATQEGFQASKNLMISIERIEVPRLDGNNQAISGAYGTFSLIVNELSGTRLVEVERFDNLNLNPSSENYVAKKIGTQYYTWDKKEKRNKVYGTHPSNSEYIRIEMAAALREKPPADSSLVPFGFLGPVVPDDIEANLTAIGALNSGATALNSSWLASVDMSLGALSSNANSKIRIQWPTLPLVHSASLSDGHMLGASPYKQSWSADSNHTTNTILNQGYVDYLRRASSYETLAEDQSSGATLGERSKYSFVFTMDDVVMHPSPGSTVAQISDAGDVALVEYVEGSRNGVGDATASSARLVVTAPTVVHGMTAGQKITLTSNDASNTAKVYQLVDPLTSDQDKTVTRSTVNVIAANSALGAGALVSTTKGILADAIDGGNNGQAFADGHRLTITVPTVAGADATGGAGSIVIIIKEGLGASPNEIQIKRANATQANIIKAINGTGGDTAEVVFASAGRGQTGVTGLRAFAGTGSKVSLEFTRGGNHGTASIVGSSGTQMVGAGADQTINVPAGSGVAADQNAIAIVMTGTQANVLANLNAAIIHTSGHGGKIIVDTPEDASDNVLVLKQQLTGTSGDKAITENIANLVATGAKGTVNKFEGGKTAKTSYAKTVADTSAMKPDGLRPMLSIVEGFRAPMVGGFEGVDVTEADPFNNRILGGNDGAYIASTKESYAYASVDRAIELVRDAEMVEHNLAVMPGITNASLTTKLIRDCEARADSLAIIDLPDVYVPPFEKKCDNFEARMPSAGKPEKAAKSLSDRQLNSSYGAAYYPWVKIKDEAYNRDVWVPPSVVALGVMAYTEERDEVWFAPAGFNRGGLNEGNAGVPVLQVSNQLMSKDRDTLYAANINPIASFVSEGIVIFGQKTLQSTQSALDRINVRRLLIFVKKKVSRVSKDLLFEQNVRATWNKFLAQVNPFLESVKTRFGLSDYKVVLDSTTTTPDLVDRNILYAKVLLKPARSIEFIAVDFVITNTGASFED